MSAQQINTATNRQFSKSQTSLSPLPKNACIFFLAQQHNCHVSRSDIKRTPPAVFPSFTCAPFHTFAHSYMSVRVKLSTADSPATAGIFSAPGYRQDTLYRAGLFVFCCCFFFFGQTRSNEVGKLRAVLQIVAKV